MEPTPITDEKDLLLRLREGDHRAFESIYHAYKSRLIHNLLRMVKSRELVEELMQDLFLSLWENRARIDPAQPFKAYLFTVAGNLAKNMLRKAAYDQRLYAFLLSAASDAAYTHIEEQLATKENKALLEQLLDKLPPQRRKVYRLCKLEGKSYREVSEALGISEGTVNDHIRKANRFFKDLQVDPRIATLAVAYLLTQGF